MKYLFVLASVFLGPVSFSQWTRVIQLPDTDISSVYHRDHILYAGGKGLIYISRDNGRSWDSTSPISQLVLVTSMIVHKNELYVAGPNSGVFKSPDEGATWENVSAGIFPDVADFCEFRGDLYAATLGNSVYKLNPGNGNSWLFFSNGLSSLSANLPSIAGTGNALIAGTLANGLYDYLPLNSVVWEERLLAGQLDPNEGAYDIVTAHDTLFYSGRTGKFYMSTDHGLSWNFIGERLASAATTLVNAKQGLVISRHIFEGGSFKTLFYYLKKDSLQGPFINFSVVGDAHFTYKIDILGDKLWDASNKGLFFMSLSDLPGMSAADDTTTPILLPVRFVLFNARCEGNEELINWKTAQEQSSSHFTVERSRDGLHWIEVGTLPADGNSTMENSYSFTDHQAVLHSYYRIAQYDVNGRAQYSDIIKCACPTTESFALLQNPFRDRISLQISADQPSQVLIKMIDGKGALVKLHKARIVQGSNQVTIEAGFLPAGLYHLWASWNNGQMQRSMQVVKW